MKYARWSLLTKIIATPLLAVSLLSPSHIYTGFGQCGMCTSTFKPNFVPGGSPIDVSVGFSPLFIKL